MDFNDSGDVLCLALYDIYNKNSDHLESVVNGLYFYDIKTGDIKTISKFEKSEYAMVKSGGENVGILLDEGKFYLFDKSGNLKLQESILNQENMIYTLVSVDNKKAVFQKIVLNNKSSSQNLIEYTHPNPNLYHTTLRHTPKIILQIIIKIFSLSSHFS